MWIESGLERLRVLSEEASRLVEGEMKASPLAGLIIVGPLQ